MYCLLGPVLVFCLLLESNALLSLHRDENPIVSIESGTLMGKNLHSFCNDQYNGFYGIPYAKPPINELRFKSPQPPDKWNGVRNAKQQSEMCVQKSLSGNHAIGDENCLYANVFTRQLPNGNNTTLKPVLVFIHGGGFSSGSSDKHVYGSSYLMCEDIVLVTFNYRLNMFGFLSFDDPTVGVPGNAGLKDQVRLLEWVKENIAHFSGDPNSVTIFGQSAGAASVHLLQLSPMARGLYHRAISNSGTALQPFVFTPRRYRELASILKYDGDMNNQTGIFQFLMKFDSNSLLLAQKQLRSTFPPYLGDRCETAVTIENSIDNPDPFITEPPEDIMAKKEYNDVPYLLGFNTEEGAFYLVWDSTVHYNFTENQETIPRFLNIAKNTPKAMAFGNKIKQFYYGDQIPSYANLNNYYNLMTDIIYAHKITQVAKSMAMHSESPIFVYVFGYKTELNWASRKVAATPHPATSHCDELGYLFKNLLNIKPIVPKSDAAIGVYRMVKLWTNFAKSGDPNPKSPDKLIDVSWEPISKDHFYYLNIDKDCGLRENPIENRLAFWNNLEKCAKSVKWMECLRNVDIKK